MKKKLRVAFLFGGRSAEHEISLLSMKNILSYVDREKYEPVLVGVDKKGIWHLCDQKGYLQNDHHPKLISLVKGKEIYSAQSSFVNLEGHHSGPSFVDCSSPILPQYGPPRDLQNLGHSETLQNSQNLTGQSPPLSSEPSLPIDLVFPWMHGTYAEDGTIQGLLKLTGLPFVGAGVLGSAVGMDKDVTKRLLQAAGLPIAKFYRLTKKEKEIPFEEIVEKLGLPLFVKPANLGSSVGVSKVKSKKDWEGALEKAFRFDTKILIEEFIEGKEIECAVILSDPPIVSLPGEAIPQIGEFYTYDSKYLEGGVLFEVPAKIEKDLIPKVQELAIKACHALYCEGTARVDMFLKKNGEIVINEINTLPGFTKTSAYPLLWEGSGVSLTEVIDRLIQLALERHEKEKQLKTAFEED